MIINLHKKIFLGFLLFLIFSFAFLSFRTNNMRLKEPLTYYSELIEQGELDDLILIIYYLDPYILTNIPMSVDRLIKGGYEYKVIIEGSKLKEHITLLNQISADILMPIEHEPHVNARLYYLFESKKYGKIIDVTMWGNNDIILVNGLEAMENDIFYDVVMPFLPKDASNKLETYINARKLE